jgi:hypothetical protein
MDFLISIIIAAVILVCFIFRPFWTIWATSGIVGTFLALIRADSLVLWICCAIFFSGLALLNFKEWKDGREAKLSEKGLV